MGSPCAVPMCPRKAVRVLPPAYVFEVCARHTVDDLHSCNQDFNRLFGPSLPPVSRDCAADWTGYG